MATKRTSGKAVLTRCNLGLEAPVAPETPADPVAAELAAIRRRAEQITGEHDTGSCDLDGETCTGHDAERLLAAVEAAMRFHAPQESADGTRFCAFCSCAEGTAVRSPCPEVRAISAALLSEEGGGHG